MVIGKGFVAGLILALRESRGSNAKPLRCGGGLGCLGS